jgi:hypothetical protein
MGSRLHLGELLPPTTVMADARHRVCPACDARAEADTVQNDGRNASASWQPLRIATQPNSDEEFGVDLIQDEGGESSCRAHLLCSECGVVLDGGAHAEDCSLNAVA